MFGSVSSLVPTVRLVSQDEQSYWNGQDAKRSVAVLDSLNETQCPVQARITKDLSRIATDIDPAEPIPCGKGSDVQSFLDTVTAYGDLPDNLSGSACDKGVRPHIRRALEAAVQPTQGVQSYRVSTYISTRPTHHSR